MLGVLFLTFLKFAGLINNNQKGETTKQTNKNILIKNNYIANNENYIENNRNKNLCFDLTDYNSYNKRKNNNEVNSDKQKYNIVILDNGVVIKINTKK